MDMILRETAIRALKKGLARIDLETLKKLLRSTSDGSGKYSALAV